MPERHFDVSVIIPVYNAANYVRNAVESAVGFDEVKEVVLIEDGSPDNALEVCIRLQKEYEKVKLYQHPQKDNRGAGETRNLGIEKARCEYIAFLDADDWYLPNRFLMAKRIFLADSEVDGVYEATGFYYEATGQHDPHKLTTIRNNEAGNLLVTLLKNSTGRFTTDAITIKRSILMKSGLFDTSLRLHQDTHLWLRLAYVGNFMPGEVSRPVAIRRVHDQNRIQHVNRESRNLLHIKTFQWFENQNNVDVRAYRIMFKRYTGALKNSLFSRFAFAVAYLLKNPENFRKLI